MRVFQTDDDGFFVGQTVADPDPLDKGNWLIPRGCVKETPPAISNGQRARWTGGVWVIVDPEPEPEPEPKPTPEELKLKKDAEEKINALHQSARRKLAQAAGLTPDEAKAIFGSFA